MEADISIVENVNDTLIKGLMKNDKECWENALYLQLECLEVAGIHF